MGVSARPRSRSGRQRAPLSRGRCALARWVFRAPPELDRPWVRAPQWARPPGPHAAREAEVTVAGPGGGPSPRSQPALGVGDMDRASGWWRRKGLQTGGSGGQPRPGTSEEGRPGSTDFWRLPGRPGRTAGAVGETEIGRSLDGARGRPAGLVPGSGARPAQSQYLTRFLKLTPHGKFKLPLVACSHPSSQQSPTPPPTPPTHTGTWPLLSPLTLSFSPRVCPAGSPTSPWEVANRSLGGGKQGGCVFL